MEPILVVFFLSLAGLRSQVSVVLFFSKWISYQMNLFLFVYSLWKKGKPQQLLVLLTHSFILILLFLCNLYWITYLLTEEEVQTELMLFPVLFLLCLTVRNESELLSFLSAYYLSLLLMELLFLLSVREDPLLFTYSWPEPRNLSVCGTTNSLYRSTFIVEQGREGVV